MHMPQGVACLAASMSAHRTSHVSKWVRRGQKSAAAVGCTSAAVGCTAATADCTAAAGSVAGQCMAVRRQASGYSASFVQL
jgi:hypothetical protein